MQARKQELLNQILAYMARNNRGPGQSVPVKTIWINLKCPNGEELSAVLKWAIEELAFLTHTSGGPGGLGCVALTEPGYVASRQV